MSRLRDAPALTSGFCFESYLGGWLEPQLDYAFSLAPSGSKNGIADTTTRVGMPSMSMLSTVPICVNGSRRCAVASTVPSE